MPITVPPSVNYPSPLNAHVSRINVRPLEGDMYIPCEILWATMGGASKAVSFNLKELSTKPFSQIVALKVDNSECGASVRFTFLDTMETVTIPAYTPDAIVPVFTNALQFYVEVDGSIPSDITRFQVLNHMPPPVVVPTSEEQLTAILSNIPSGVGSVNNVIPNNLNGTLETVQVQFGVAAAAAASNATITLSDGTGKRIAYASVFVNLAAYVNVICIDLANVAVRFQGGIIATIAGAGIANGEFNVSAYYKLP